MDFEINWGHTKLRLSNRRFITQWMEMNGKRAESVESFIESVSDDERFFCNLFIYLFIFTWSVRWKAAVPVSSHQHFHFEVVLFTFFRNETSRSIFLF